MIFFQIKWEKYYLHQWNNICFHFLKKIFLISEYSKQNITWNVLKLLKHHVLIALEGDAQKTGRAAYNIEEGANPSLYVGHSKWPI